MKNLIRIDYGKVTASAVTGTLGRRTIPEDIGTAHFFIDLIESDGGVIGLWSGSDYDAAIIEAEIARADFNINAPVQDCVIGGGWNGRHDEQ